MREYLAVAKAIADSSRARILKLLEAKPLCVCQIVAVLGLRPSTVSKHLSILRQAGLVEDEKSGKWVRYALARENVNAFNQTALALLKAWLNDDKRVLSDREKLKRVLALPLEEVCKTKA
jgi:DNA-binding transcriptional ArsR family regulator